MLQNFKKLTLIPKLHTLATRGEKSSIFTIFGRILAILEDILTEKEKITQKVKVVSCRYAWGAWPPFFHIQSGNASKFQKTYMNSKVSYFGHQGWKKVVFWPFWTYFGYFGGFPVWKGKIKQKVKVASCRYAWKHSLCFFIFSQEML